MNKTCFSAGAAEKSIEGILAAYYSRKNLETDNTPWGQRMRCLIFSYNDILTVILNPDWSLLFGDFAEKVSMTLEKESPHRKQQLLCFGTQGGRFPWQALRHRDKARRDARLEEEILSTIVKLYRQALRKLRPATISAGYGQCSSISGNSFWGKEHCDNNVYVLRIDDTEEKLIALIVHFSCNGRYNDSDLSGGFPVVMESMVQKIYGTDVPVLFFNGMSGDVECVCLRHPMLPTEVSLEERPGRQPLPYEFLGITKKKFYAIQHKVTCQECDRIGRVLGGEVCKVLAELEVAGQPLDFHCQRWDRVAWMKKSPGFRIEQPTLSLKTIPICLWFRPPTSLEECEERTRTLEEEAKSMEKFLPYTPRCYAPYSIDPDDEPDEIYRWMEIRGQWWYWHAECGRTKTAKRLKKSQERLSEVRVLVFSRDVAVVGFPGEMCYETAEAIKEKSPFTMTLIWDSMAHSNLTRLIPESEAVLGGHHSSFMAYAQDSIDQMVEQISSVLSEVYCEIKGD